MQRRVAAKSYLQLHIARVQRILVAEPSVGETALQYAQLVETLSEQLVLDDDGAAAALQLVRDDPVLDDITKLVRCRPVDFPSSRVLMMLFHVQKHVGRVEERVAALRVESQAATSVAPRSSTRNVNVEAQAQSSTQPARSSSSGDTTEDDNSYALLGGTAIAVAVAAIGAIRYRDRIHESVSQVLPAISKGLADVKYALFD